MNSRGAKTISLRAFLRVICVTLPFAAMFFVINQSRCYFSALNRWASLCILAGFLTVPAHAALQRYTADVNTLHLWHFDEISAPFEDAVAGGTNLTYLTGGATAGHAGLSNGTVTFSNSLNFGSFTTSNAVLFAAGSGSVGAPVPFAFAGSDGAFTFEVLVRIGFNSTNFIRNQPIQILNGDANGSGGGTRVFQFRLLPVGFPGGGGDTNVVRIEFINGITTVAVVPIPTNGPDAIASNNWYHVAVTYNGSANTTSNLLFYWTLANDNRPVANVIFGATMTSALPGVSSATTIFSVGNSARNPGGGSGPSVANFLGDIDEVRISSVARASNEFIFQNISVSASSYQPGTSNYPSNTLDGNLSTRWSAQGDGQYITYDLGRVELTQSIDLAFYQPSSVRTNWFDVLLSNDGVAWRNTLTNASGTNASLANFDFPDWPARYVRVVGHLNSQNDFNSITETVIHYAVPMDADRDGLPDVWELYYFGNLTNTPAGDPDGDSQSNAYEFLHGTDPTIFNFSGDTDNDGLPDAWEMANFGTLSYGANDDPDRDGFSNLQEYLAGSDPMNANSIPSDINGNNLPDAWETNAFAGFVASAYDDADGDGCNNLAEMVWGTNPTDAASHPSFVSPRVALLNDSVVATNACLMPFGSTYGRAINGISFQTRILPRFDGYEYTAWYDTTGSGATTQTVWLARRTVTNTVVGPWEKFSTGSIFVNGKTGWDAHDVISLGISPTDGTLHFAWDMHGRNDEPRAKLAGEFRVASRQCDLPDVPQQPIRRAHLRVSHRQHLGWRPLSEHVPSGCGQLDRGNQIFREGRHLHRHAGHRQHRFFLLAQCLRKQF